MGKNNTCSDIKLGVHKIPDGEKFEYTMGIDYGVEADPVIVWIPRDEFGELEVCVWPDGEWCFQEDLWEMLNIKSDDYELVEYDENIHK